MLLPFDVDAFRKQFPEFADVAAFPDEMLTMYWEMAHSFLQPDCSPLGASVGLGMRFMEAHLLHLSRAASRGQAGGFVTRGVVDKVDVSVLAPPTDSMFEWWLAQTPYGQQLAALMQSFMVGGFSVGGAPESSAFRQYGGEFS